MADIAPTPSVDLQTTSSEQIDTSPTPPAMETPSPKPQPGPRGPTRFEKLNSLYALPAPLRTFPLPTFTPHNPLSIFHLLYVWFRQKTTPHSSTFDPVYEGWFSPETRSVHITDHRSIRGLWEQGFYGKGSLSRSEPSWITRETTRRGTTKKVTSEEVTAQRRLERQQVKWERARKAREAIEQTLAEEAGAESIISLPDSVGEDFLTPENGHSPVSSGLRMTNGTSSSNAEVLEVSSTVIMNGSAKSLAKSPKYIASPVGPFELLSLPNSSVDSGIDINGLHSLPTDHLISRGNVDLLSSQDLHRPLCAPVGPLQLLALPNSSTSSAPMDTEALQYNGHVEEPKTSHIANGLRNGTHVNGDSESNGKVMAPVVLESNSHTTVVEAVVPFANTNDHIINSKDSLLTNGTSNGQVHANGGPSTPTMKRQKNVRFSPTIEQTTFIQSEPPSPARSVLAAEEHQEQEPEPEPPAIKDQEHMQITLEEAFFLSYALGALTILDSTTRSPIPRCDLLQLFRRTSYFPPLANPSLAPDDPFMVNYVVYHNYRSLGWNPRPGIKFSCDFMLYNRGPVFDHADFGLVILPSYSHRYWSSDAFLQNYVKSKESKTWHWLMCINRVITQVKKTLVLCYVDIPPPLSADEEAKMGVDGMLGRYKIREVVLKRFSPSRMRM